MIYLVPTPIGNLEDITLRALRILEEADLIACEDTRVTSKLLNHYNIKNKLISYHKHNEKERSDELLLLAKRGKNIALVSDAGMPGISDPGYELIQKAIELGVEYTVLPGASASLTSLILSGYSSDKFIFLGFIPFKGKERKEYLRKIKDSEETIILYESPHKLDKTMKDLQGIIPDRKVAIVREVSKVYEEVIRFKLKDYDIQEFQKKGEIVIIIDSYTQDLSLDDSEITSLLLESMRKGNSKKESVRNISNKFGLKKNRVYELSLKI